MRAQYKEIKVDKKKLKINIQHQNCTHYLSNPDKPSIPSLATPLSASDERWSGVDDLTKSRLGLTKLADGEFWMEFGDFCEQFEETSVCTLGPDYDHDGRVDHVGQVGPWSTQALPRLMGVDLYLLEGCPGTPNKALKVC